MKKTFKRLTAILMAMVMVLAMSSSVFATGEEDATINYYIYDDKDGISWNVDTVSVASGQSVFDALENSGAPYEPKWDTGKDVFNGETVKYLTNFMGYQSNINVDHQYNADNSGWSIDWGWLYTVGPDHVMPSFPGEPNHGMAMNQYIIKPGDSIDVVYTLTRTEWDAQYNTTFEILHPWY